MLRLSDSGKSRNLFQFYMVLRKYRLDLPCPSMAHNNIWSFISWMWVIIFVIYSVSSGMTVVKILCFAPRDSLLTGCWSESTTRHMIWLYVVVFSSENINEIKYLFRKESICNVICVFSEYIHYLLCFFFGWELCLKGSIFEF